MEDIEKIINYQVAKRLRERRAELGLSQQEVAEFLGVTFQQVRKYEVGSNRISCGKLYMLCMLFRTTIDYFFVPARRG